jgi:hypothetical protein
LKTIALSDVTESEISTAAEEVISGIKAYNRKLDTRKGTVLRDLLVDPEAAIESVIEKQTDVLRNSTSLKAMNDAESNGEQVDMSDVEAVLSNFNMSAGTGRKASGLVKIVVNDDAITHIAPEGMVVQTIDGTRFVLPEVVIASSRDVENPSVKPTTELYKGTAGYFFLAAAVAEDIGAAGNITQGTSLECPDGSMSYISMEAYKDFDGGLDALPLSQTISNIPSALSMRGFVSSNSIEGMLRDKFDAGDHPMSAVSSVGYGNGAQRRDKHNMMGVSVGGRVDVYVRNFGDVCTVTKVLTGTRDGNVYRISAPAGTFPGSCWVKSVEDMEPPSSSDDESGQDLETVLGSLDFTAIRTADIGDTWHDIRISGSDCTEAFNTVWQGFGITLYDVPPNVAPEDDGDEWTWSEDREFKVTVYCIPQALDIQNYMDDSSVRSIASDVIVRCPILCRVSIKANVRYDPANPVDEDYAKSKIRSYVNGLGFVGRLTRSEIVHILKNCGAVAVDMPAKDMLYGKMHDARGSEILIQGDALDISSVEDYSSMLTPDTVVFSVEREDVQLIMIPNSR